MKITEEKIPAERMKNIIAVARRSEAILGLEIDRSSPGDLVKAIDECIVSKSKRDPVAGEDIWEEIAMPLGSLFAQIIVKKFQWEWGKVTFHGPRGYQADGIFSKDRSLAAYPFHFMCGCIGNFVDVTIKLTYNKLKEPGGIPTLPRGGYENILENIVRLSSD